MRILSTAEIERAFAGNRFASFHEGFGRLALPLDSKLTIVVPGKRGDHGEIRISNRFCALTIDTVSRFGGRTLGSYGALLNIDPTANEFWNHNFVVRVTVSFTESLASAPEMVRIKQWANDMASGLQAAFDEQTIWRKTLENFQLRMQMGQNWRNLAPGLRPVKFAEKPPAENKAAPEK